jgi:hypothetical protein
MGCGASAPPARNSKQSVYQYTSDNDSVWSRVGTRNGTHATADGAAFGDDTQRDPTLRHETAPVPEAFAPEMPEFFNETMQGSDEDGTSDDGWYGSSAVLPGKLLRGSQSLSDLERGLRGTKSSTTLGDFTKAATLPDSSKVLTSESGTPPPQQPLSGIWRPPPAVSAVSSDASRLGLSGSLPLHLQQHPMTSPNQGGGRPIFALPADPRIVLRERRRAQDERVAAKRRSNRHDIVGGNDHEGGGHRVDRDDADATSLTSATDDADLDEDRPAGLRSFSTADDRVVKPEAAANNS